MISLSVANAELSQMRSAVGASAALWAGADGVRVEPGRWVALSGVRSIRYNAILCHGASDGELLKASVDDIAAAGVPGVIIVAGGALGEVNHLAELGWVCAGAAMFMIRDLEEAASLPQDPNVRKLAPDELPAARRIIADRFALTDELALAALPPDSAERPGQSVWAGFDDRGEMVSCIAAVDTGEYLCTWSLAISQAARGRGYAHRLHYTMFADAASHHRVGLAHVPLHNEPVHRSLGYVELERWQVWSRPRWVFSLLG